MNDSPLQFLRQCCEVVPPELHEATELSADKTELYELYQLWADVNRVQPLDRWEFGRAMSNLGFKPGKRPIRKQQSLPVGSVAVWRGLLIK